MALGLFVSAFAPTEFQAVQFMPALVFPQLLLCGLFVARDADGGLAAVVSDVLPLTYAYDALAKVAAGGPYGARFVADVRGDRRAPSVLALVLAAVHAGAAADSRGATAS